MKYVSRGQVRSRLWVVKVIGQLYADKAVADAAADAQGQQRSGIAAFTVKWHLNRLVAWEATGLPNRLSVHLQLLRLLTNDQ